MKSLDKYLTEEPDDGFDGWADDVVGCHITDEFFDENEGWLNNPDGVANKWMCDLYYNKGKTPSQAARIIERAFNINLKIKK